MNQDTKHLEDTIKEKIIRILVALFPHAKIYLFGSRATGKNQPLSDIDIAIDAGKQLPIEDIDEANAIMVELNIPYKVDIVDFHHIPSTMQDLIKKEKVIWKQ